jgi:hypothetical protein
MSACVFDVAGRAEEAAEALQHAASAMRQMCIERHNWTLLIVNVATTWMALHDDGKLGYTIMSTVFGAARGVLDENDPLVLILEWMKSAADAAVNGAQSLKMSRITTNKLREIAQGFKDYLGAESYNFICSEYILCFQLLHVDELFQECADRLERLHKTALEVLVESDIVVLQIQATLSRAQLRLGRTVLALETIKRCVEQAPLGLNHPHRLELLNRMAFIEFTYGSVVKAEQLYFDITVGRGATLGPTHKRTLAAYDSLKTASEKNGTWEEKKRAVDQMLNNPNEGSSAHERWFRSHVELLSARR